MFLLPFFQNPRRLAGFHQLSVDALAPEKVCVVVHVSAPELANPDGISYLKHPKATSSCWLLLDLTCKNVQKAPIKIIGPVQVGSLPLKLLHFTNKTEGMKI